MSYGPVPRSAPGAGGGRDPEAEGNGGEPRRRVRILHVEDDAVFADLVRAMLAAVAPEFEVEHADGLSSALARLVRERYEVIVTDLDLPDSEGADTVRHLQRAGHHAPLVVLSGTGDQVVSVEALHEGADDFVVKGALDADNVARLVRVAVERHRRHKTRDAGGGEPAARPPGLAALRAVGGNIIKVVERMGLHLTVVLLRVGAGGSGSAARRQELVPLFHVLRGALRRGDFIYRVGPAELAVVLVGRRPEPGAGMGRLEAAVSASEAGPHVWLGFALYDRAQPVSIEGLIAQARHTVRPIARDGR